MKPAKIAFVILIAFALSGCAYLQGVKLPKLPGIEQEEKQVTYGGTEGITARIVHPKEEGMVLGETFEPVVRVSNLGGFRAEGQTCISGLDADIFSGFSGCECETFSQDAKSTEAELADLKFGPYSIRKETAEEKSYALTSITRYRYGTDIKAEICIANDIYDNKDCSAEIVSVTSGPLSVSSVEENIIPLQDKYVTIIFTLHIEKEADGALWDLNRINERCVPVKAFEEEAKIKASVKSFPVSGEIKCSGGTMNADGEASVNCEARDIALYDSKGRIIFDEGYKPEAIFELEYGFESRASNSFTLA